MTKQSAIQTDFSAGEISPSLSGRIDLQLYQKGASELTNVRVLPTGGVQRREGTTFIHFTPNGKRLLGLETADKRIVIVLFEYGYGTWDGVTYTEYPNQAPWRETDIPELASLEYDSELLICHPAWAPRKLIEMPDGSFSCETWTFDVAVDDDGNTYSTQPLARFANAEAALQVSEAGSGSSIGLAASSTLNILANEPLFQDMAAGTIIKFKSSQIIITSIQNETTAIGVAQQKIDDGSASVDWLEQAFSENNGWPAAISLHQNRLVLSGSGRNSATLWLSQIGRPFNFDFGANLDDQAISLELAGSPRIQISYFVSGPSLQIFTKNSEWALDGRPLTPTSFQLDRLTGFGSPKTIDLPPLSVDGATLFISGKTSNELREFLFSNAEKGYQAPDLALTANHLLSNPVDFCYDHRWRQVLILRSDGNLISVQLNRLQGQIAWTKFRFTINPTNILSTENELFLLFDDGSQCFLAKFDQSTKTDFTRNFESVSENQELTGFDHIDGLPVQFLAEEKSVGSGVVANGSVIAPSAFTNFQVGSSFEHVIMPLRLTNTLANIRQISEKYRIVRLKLLFENSIFVQISQSNRSDFRSYFLDSENPDTLLNLSYLGWNSFEDGPPWIIKQDHPSDFTLLFSNIEMKV